MRLKAINYIFLVWTATALASDASESTPRPLRYLHHTKEMIDNKIFRAPKCTQSQPEQPETKFYKIPGFESVVIKAVPKIPTELPTIVDNIPPNSQIGIIGSYLGTNTLNDTFNALQGVNNLLYSGILDAHHGELDELTFIKPTSVQNIPLAPGTFNGFVKNPGVFVTEHKLPAPPVHQLRPPAPGFSGLSYNQDYSDGKMASFTGSGTQEYGVNVAVSAPVTPEFQGMPPASRSFSYKQIDNGKVTTYNGAGIVEEGRGVNPAVMVHAVNHPVPRPHIADRIQKVAAEAKCNRPPLMSDNPFTVPVPTDFLHIPSVHTRISHRPVKISSTSGMSPFVYKHIHRDSSGSSFGDGAVTVDVKSQAPNMAMPIPSGYHRVFETPMNTGPFPMEVNSNAMKPSTPVSGSYYYNIDHIAPVNIPERLIDGYQNIITPPNAPVRNNQLFPVPPPMPVRPAPATGWVDTQIAYPNFSPTPVVFQERDAVKSSTPVSGSYFYKLANNGPVNIPEGLIDGYQNNITPPDVPVRNYQPFPVPPPMPARTVPAVGRVDPKIAYRNFGQTPVVFQERDAVKSSTPVSGSYSYKLANNRVVNIQEGLIDGYQNNITPPDIPVRNNQPFPKPPSMSVVPNPAPSFVDPEIASPNVGPFPVVFQEHVIPLSYKYKQINHNKPGEFLVVKVEDPVRDMKKVYERLQNNQVNQRYPNGFPTGEVYPNPYYFVPPPSNGPAPFVPQIPQDKIPPSSYSYKQATKGGVFEYSNNFGSTGDQTNNPITSESIENPQENPAGNVEQTLLEIASNQNALTNNPIVVPEPTSVSFKQSIDGSSVTEKDGNNGQNSVSVDIEPARSESPQGQEPSRFNTEEDGRAPSPSPVQEHAASTEPDQSQEAPKAETTSRKPMVRRRKIKRVIKPRGDIPDAES